MAIENKLVELVAEMLIKQDEMILELQGVKNVVMTISSDVSLLKEDVSILKEDVSILKEDVSVLKEDVSVLKQDMSAVKNDILGIQRAVMKLNLQTAENTRATMKLADGAGKVVELESRVSKLEKNG